MYRIVFDDDGKTSHWVWFQNEPKQAAKKNPWLAVLVVVIQIIVSVVVTLWVCSLFMQ